VLLLVRPTIAHVSAEPKPLTRPPPLPYALMHKENSRLGEDVHAHGLAQTALEGALKRMAGSGMAGCLKRYARLPGTGLAGRS